jgi:hypothetical protein
MGQFIPACRVALRLKFYLWNYSLTCLWSQVKASHAEFQGQCSYPFGARNTILDFTIEALLKDTIFPLNRMYDILILRNSTLYSASFLLGKNFMYSFLSIMKGTPSTASHFQGAVKYTSIHVDWRSTPSTAFLSTGHSTLCSISCLPCVARLVLHLSPLLQYSVS